jgi:ABC-type uncharacterized transport system auxiliary subunit
VTRRAPRSRGRRTALAAACALAAGCLGSPAPPDRYYRLEPAAPARLAAPAFPGVLEVGRFRSDSVARGTALVWVAEAGENEVRTRPYDRWVDSPTLLLQRETAAALRTAGLAREVVTPEVGVEPDHRLGGQLLRFEEVRGPGAPRVVVELEVEIVDARRAAIAFHATYREEREIGGPEAADAVRAYDAAVSALLARLVADAAAGPRP